MRILKASIYLISTGGFRFPIVELSTDIGIKGVGEAALGFGVGAEASVTMIKELTQNFVIGKSPLEINKIWNNFYYDTFWGKGAGPIFYGAVSALEIALWDIKGKVFNMPVYEFLGGKMRGEIQCYANDWSFDGLDPKGTAKRAEEVRNDGYDALKLYPLGGRGGKNSVNKHFLLREVKKDDEKECVKKVAEVRKAIGDDADMLVDVTAEGTPDIMIRIGKAIEEYSPYFYEEPLDMFDIDSYRFLKNKVNIPIAAGERLYTRYSFKRLIENRCVDIVQPDPGICGGIFEAYKIASMAEAYQMRTAPHNAGGPVLMAANVQLSATLSNFAMLEVFPYRTQLHYDIVQEALDKKIKNGRLNVPEMPGIGVELNHKVIDNFEIVRVE